MDGMRWFHANASLNDLRVLDLITSADMKTDMRTAGPVTIFMESKKLRKGKNKI